MSFRDEDSMFSKRGLVSQLHKHKTVLRSLKPLERGSKGVCYHSFLSCSLAASGVPKRETSVFVGKNDSDLSVLHMMRNDSFQCHRGFGHFFRVQKRDFREKVALDTSGSESAGVLQSYSELEWMVK